jgi:hypothetical protein
MYDVEECPESSQAGSLSSDISLDKGIAIVRATEKFHRTRYWRITISPHAKSKISLSQQQ